MPIECGLSFFTGSNSTTAANMVSMAVQAGKKMEGTLDVTSIRTI